MYHTATRIALKSGYINIYQHACISPGFHNSCHVMSNYIYSCMDVMTMTSEESMHCMHACRVDRVDAKNVVTSHCN